MHLNAIPTCNVNCNVYCCCVKAVVCKAGVSSLCQWRDSKAVHCSQYWHIIWLIGGKEHSICFHSNPTPRDHCSCNSEWHNTSRSTWYVVQFHCYMVPRSGTGLPSACSHCTSPLNSPVDWQVTLNSRPGFTVYTPSFCLCGTSSTGGGIPRNTYTYHNTTTNTTFLIIAYDTPICPRMCNNWLLFMIWKLL